MPADDPNEPGGGDEAAREVAWTPVWDDARQGWGVELLRLAGRRASSSAILFDAAGVPFELTWELTWDADWIVRDVAVDAVQRSERRTVRLRSDGRGNWSDGDGAALPELAACLDVDIWPTPFTNTFPIRRLPPRTGERMPIRVVYIEAPALRITVARQAYTRLGSDHYRFETDDFRAELRTDGDGIVLDYPGLFRRLL